MSWKKNKDEMIILGVDPGSIRCGYGILKVESGIISVVDYGLIQPKKSSNSFIERLKVIYGEIALLINSYNVNETAVETQFYAKNPQSLIKLSQARTSVILAALNQKIRVYEYSPKLIKLAVTGKGSASKRSVNYMISKLLKINHLEIIYDVTDALAIAYCHLVHSNLVNDEYNNHKFRKWEEYIKFNPHRVKNEY